MRPALIRLLLPLLALHAAEVFAQAPIAVTLRPLSEVVVYPEQSAPATVRSLNESRLSAEINARILAIDAKVGEAVKRGQALVRLDCRDNRLALRRAQANLDLAGQQLERTRTLHAEANASKELLNQREAEHATAEVAFRQAEINVERCVVRAPFDGVLIERLASEGELAAPGTPLLELLDAGRIEVSAQVSIDAVDDLAAAGRVWFEQQGQRYPLELRAITPAVNPQARNREARYEFAAERPLPGAAGRMVWRASRPHVPADLLMRRAGTLGLMIAQGERARFVPLPAALEGHPAAVDLPLDTRLILEGRQALNDGDAINLIAGNAAR